MRQPLWRRGKSPAGETNEQAVPQKIGGCYIHNCPLKGIGVRDFYACFVFFLLAGRFSIGCGSKFRAEVAYLEVGSSDFEQIHEKHYLHEISDIFMGKISGKTISDIFMGKI